MKRFALVGAELLSIAAFTGAVSAADLPARPYTKAPSMIPALYDWTGFYIGLNGGGGSARECHTITSVDNENQKNRSSSANNAESLNTTVCERPRPETFASVQAADDF